MLYEEFIDGRKRKGLQCVAFYRRANEWHRYCLPRQVFSTLKRLTPKQKKEKVDKLIEVMPDRTFARCPRFRARLISALAILTEPVFVTKIPYPHHRLPIHPLR